MVLEYHQVFESLGLVFPFGPRVLKWGVIGLTEVLLVVVLVIGRRRVLQSTWRVGLTHVYLTSDIYIISLVFYFRDSLSISQISSRDLLIASDSLLFSCTVPHHVNLGHIFLWVLLRWGRVVRRLLINISVFIVNQTRERFANLVTLHQHRSLSFHAVWVVFWCLSVDDPMNPFLRSIARLELRDSNRRVLVVLDCWNFAIAWCRKPHRFFGLQCPEIDALKAWPGRSPWL